MMEVASTSETSVNFYQTTRRNNTEDTYFHTRRRENLRSHLVQCLTMDWMTGVRSPKTGSGAHSASCPMGTGGPFPGGKALPGRDADHSPPSSEVKNEYLYLLSAPSVSTACSGTAFLQKYPLIGDSNSKLILKICLPSGSVVFCILSRAHVGEVSSHVTHSSWCCPGLYLFRTETAQSVKWLSTDWALVVWFPAEARPITTHTWYRVIQSNVLMEKITWEGREFMR
jgi:hypothetical protein